MSSDAFVVSILFPGRISNVSKGARMHETTEDFCEFSSFAKSVRGAPTRLLERVESLQIALRISGKVHGCV
mgnify:CR=1 FL=1